MSRAELAQAINAYLHRVHGFQGCVDETYIGKLERGTHRWPQERYREALRWVLAANTDAELGFFITRTPAPTPSPTDDAATRLSTSVQTVDAERRTLEAKVMALRQTLLEGGSKQEPSMNRLDSHKFGAAVKTMRGLRATCNYSDFVSTAPGVLSGLHAAKRSNAKLALTSLIQVCDELSFVMRHLGFPADAWMAAEHAQAAAELVGLPSMLGLAAWTRSQAALTCHAHRRAYDLASRGIALLMESRNTPEKPEVEGQLHLTCAHALAHLGRVPDAAEHLAEAKKISLSTGETETLGLMFGPTNVAFWQVSFQVRWGDPAAAVAIAELTQPGLVRSASRQAAFYIDLAHAMVLEGNDFKAVRALNKVQQLAPQKFATSPDVRRLTTMLTHRFD